MEAIEKKPRRPAGYWEDEGHIERELRAWVEKHGKFPSTLDLDTTRDTSLRAAIIAHGGVNTWRIRFGFETVRTPADQWDDARIERELRAWVEKQGSFPTQELLNKAGALGLKHAMEKIGFLGWRRRLGHELRKKPQGYWDSEANTERELRAWIEKHGSFPTERKLSDQRSLSHAMQRHGGANAWRERLGHKLLKKRPGHWNNEANVERELDEWIKKHGKFPTGQDLDRTGHAYIRGAIVKRGMEHWRAKLGFGPVTPEVLREHADVLALIVMTLGITDTGAFWETIQKRWTVRELREAIRAFMEGAGRFRELLTAG